MAQISALTGGGVVELRAGPGEGMTIAVRWAQDGKSMAYGHAISMHEMKAMHQVVQPCVLDSITHAVRKMTPNAEVSGGPPGPSTTITHGSLIAGGSPGATGSTATGYRP